MMVADLAELLYGFIHFFFYHPDFTVDGQWLAPEGRLEFLRSYRDQAVFPGDRWAGKDIVVVFFYPVEPLTILRSRNL